MTQASVKTNVQVALDEDVRDMAVLKAREYGFDNLPTMVRYIVVNIVHGELIPTRLGRSDNTYFDEETQKNIGIALKEYEEGKYEALKSKKEIRAHYAKMNAAIEA